MHYMPGLQADGQKIKQPFQLYSIFHKMTRHSFVVVSNQGMVTRLQKKVMIMSPDEMKIPGLLIL